MTNPVVITDKAIHAAARELCRQTFGDWRYDPGNGRFVKFEADAERVLQAAAPHMEVERA